MDCLSRILNNGVTAMGYDGRGNLTSSGSSSYGYNADNLMTSAPNGTTLQYDALGRLAQLTASSWRRGYAVMIRRAA